jgi:hypothetical protein
MRERENDEKKIFNKINEKINSNVLININSQLLPKLYLKVMFSFSAK